MGAEAGKPIEETPFVKAMEAEKEKKQLAIEEKKRGNTEEPFKAKATRHWVWCMDGNCVLLPEGKKWSDNIDEKKGPSVLAVPLMTGRGGDKNN